MNTIQIVSQILGSFSLFFFGLKLMSEGLQSLSESRIKYLMSKQAKGPWDGFLRSCFVGLCSLNIRSARLMALGLLNAGLLPFKDMLIFFLGSAVGGSLIYWSLSFGLENYLLKISALGMLLLLFKVPFVLKDIGRFLVGLGLILLGHKFLSPFELHYILGPISNWSIQLQLGLVFVIGISLHYILNLPFLVLFLIMTLSGTQSILLGPHGLALIFGHIIGDALTLYSSLKSAHLFVKRAVFSNLIMALVTSLVGLVLLIFYSVNLTKDIMGLPLGSPQLFSLIVLFQVFIFFPFAEKVEAFSMRFFPSMPKKQRPPKLVFFGSGGDVSAALSLMQLELEIFKFKNIVDRMFSLCEEYIEAENSPRALAKLKDYERITDNIQTEITEFLCRLSQSSLSFKQAKNAHAAFRISTELEKIADYLDKLATYKTRLTSGQDISDTAQEEIMNFFKEIHHFYQVITSELSSKSQSLTQKQVENQAFGLKKQAEQIRESHLQRVETGSCQAAGSLIFSDMVVALRKIRGHTYNINQAHSAKLLSSES